MATAAQFITQTYQQPYRPAKLQRIAKADKTAFDARADAYNDFIWALARKFTNTPEEAEAAVREMFADIKQCSETTARISTSEDRLIARIAWRRLLKFLQ